MAMEMEENDAIPASDASAFRAVVPNAFPAMAQDEEEEEDEDVCRICRNPGDSENPLRYPCACSGSIKYVHQECLLQWLNHSNARHCEVCKHAFSFSPVYAKNAPARLPLQEFILGMAMKACRVLQFFLRLVFVLSVWLLIIPFITFWIWRMAFVRSFGEAHKLFLSHLSATVVLTNCLHGFLLSASIVFIFLGATSLRDYFRHLRELGGMDAEREDEGQERPGAHAIRRHPAPVNRNNAGEANGEEVGGAQGIVGAGQILRRNAENVAARLEMQAARLEAHVEQMFDGLDDADGAEDVPFDELVGMQGPVFHLVENAITVLASNGIFLAVVIFMPFSVGRVIIYYASGLFAPALNPILSSVITHMDSANVTLQNGLSLAESLTSKNITEGVVEAFTESLVINATGLDEVTKSVGRYISSDMLKGTSAGTSRFSDVTTLAIGYMFVFSLAFIYLGFVALVRYVRGEPSIMGRFYGITSILEAIPSFLRQVVVGIRHLMTMVKVAFLLVIELGVFPLMCGWWLDFCTIRMLGATIAQRVEFFSASPLASSLIHWLVGIVYMLQISIFVSLLRGVLRTGVLYFLRDPADPNYNPFRDLIDDPVHKHARRVLLSVAVYGSLIVMLIFLPVKLAMRVASSMFPLDIAVSDPFTEIPADMLLFQICIPFAIEHFKPRATIKSLLHQWFSTVGWVLGLTEFLLPRPDNVSSEDNGNIEQVRPNRFNAGGRQNDLAPVVEDRTHANRSMDVSDDSDREDQLQSNYGFVFRIVLLLVMAWITLLLFNTAVIVIPVSIGRALFNSIPRLPITHGIKCNDLYSFNIGCYIIWTAVAGIRYITDYIKSRRAGVLLGQIWKWFGIVVKSSALLSIWIFVIPVLIGLLFELLVIVPIRVPVDESPVFLLYQDWAFGLIFLKIWTRLIMMDHMAPLVDENWKMKFERVKADGFSGLRGLWVLREIVIPITMKLLMALCVPYVFAKGVFPVLGYPLIVNSTVYRFSWLGCLIFYVVWFCVKRFHVWFTNLHNTIRDDRYLIGKRLHNFGEDIEKDEPDTTLSAHQSGDGSIQNEREADIGLRLRRANR